MARRVEGHDREAGLRQRSDEGTQARAAASPAVDEKSHGPGAPFPDGDPPAVKGEIEPLRRREHRPIDVGPRVTGWAAKESRRHGGRCGRRQTRRRREESPDRAKPNVRAFTGLAGVGHRTLQSQAERRSRRTDERSRSKAALARSAARGSRRRRAA